MYVGVSFSTVYWPRDVNKDYLRMSKVHALIISKGHEVSGESTFNDWWNEKFEFPYYHQIRVGEGFVGAMRTLYMWRFPKTIGVMRMTNGHNLPIRSQCNPFTGMSYPDC